ncbi:MAG TPA: metallophosphoesterase [Candidatus Scybalocola faecavium]|nr:metallophosphoesterase [Candidatus Scybalocola faecavium]
MALYALGDLHLSFQANKPMDAFGKVWKNHEKKIEKYVNKIVKPEDTLVLTGDHSWGRKLPECMEDLAFIERLPGRKILLRGNHDMFWDAKKTERLNEEFAGRLFFLQNNFAVYKDYALVGTKGYTFEGPFYLNRRGQILGWDEEKEAQAKKLVDREMARLRESFRQAQASGYKKFIMFLHYPPTNILEKTSPFTEIAREYGVEAVVYSHCHGERRFGDSIRGEFQGIRYMLVSGDYLNFCPALVVE